MSLEPKDLKGTKKVVYLRISGREQALGDEHKPKHKQQTFKEQLARVNQYLTDHNLGKADEKFVFREIGTGADPTRPIWKESVKTAANLKGKVVYVVTELSRFARNLRYGASETIPLYENDVPMLATDERLIIGTEKRPEPDSDIMMGIKMSLSTGELETTKKKELSGRRARTESGVYHSAGLSLWPFADADMFAWLRDNIHLFKKKDEGGMGKAAFKRRLEAIGGEGGPTGAWAIAASKTAAEIAEKLSPEEYQQWEAFRQRILELEQAEGYDGARGKGKLSWPVKAIRYRFNGYLTKPFDPNFSEPTEAEWEEVYSNPRDNISAKDRKVWNIVIGKRKKR